MRLAGGLLWRNLHSGQEAAFNTGQSRRDTTYGPGKLNGLIPRDRTVGLTPLMGGLRWDWGRQMDDDPENGALPNGFH